MTANSKKKDLSRERHGHTPTPWYLAKTEWDYKTVITALDRTQIIARCGSSDFLQAEKDAEFILRAVNSHEALVKWGAALIERFERLEKIFFERTGDPSPEGPTLEVTELKKAIAQAEENK